MSLVTTQSLIGIVQALLSTPTTVDDVVTYPTSCGVRVYAPRDWPTWDLQYPALFISAPRETKVSAGRNQPQFTVTTTVRLAVRTGAPGDANDMNAGVVEAALWTIQRQIEVALVNAPSLMTQIQQIVSMEAQLAFNSTGEKHLGELLVDVDLEFYQGPWDFYPVAGDDITDVTVTTPFPVADPTSNEPSLGFAATLPPIS